MEDTTRILLEIFLTFAGARLLGRLFQAVKQPPVMSEDAYAAVLAMVLATTIVSPYLIKAVFSRKKPANDASSDPDAAPSANGQRVSSG